jgi:hypothetical protein
VDWPVAEDLQFFEKETCYLIYSANDFRRKPRYAVGYATSKALGYMGKIKN